MSFNKEVFSFQKPLPLLLECSEIWNVIIEQAGIVIKFDNQVTSQHGGHFRNRGFSYSVRFICYLFGNTRAIYPQFYSKNPGKE